jgi:LPXTG-motif cell wall-anchored protein
MEQGVTALIIVCGLILGFAGIGVAATRKRRRYHKEADDLGRRLGARWFTSQTGLPYGRVDDPLTGAALSQTSEQFDYAFAAEYRGRRVVALEYSTLSGTGNSKSRVRHHSVQVLGPRTPVAVVLPRNSIVAELRKDLTEVPVGSPEFEERFMLLVKDPASFPGLPVPALAWFLARPDGPFSMIKFTGDGFEVSAPGPLPGWDTTKLINDLVDLCDLVETGQVHPSPRLELVSQDPPYNVVLGTLSGCVIGGTVVFWLAAFTISNPSSGMVVLAILGGLLVLVIGLGWFARRRRRRGRPVPLRRPAEPLR